MTAERLRRLAAWAALVVVLVALFRGARTEGTWPMIVLAAIVVAAAMIAFWRAWSALTRLQQHMIDGNPEPILSITRRRLRYRGGGRDRGQLLVFQAAGHSMNGEWERGLLALDHVDLEHDFADDERERWTFVYHSTRFSCLLFSEAIEAARELFDEEIRPRAGAAGAELAAEAMEAELWYCEGEHIRAERVFERIADDFRSPPPARAVFHYFLGRIYRDRSQLDRAAEEFALARQNAGNTWIPDGIDALDRH